MYATNVNTQENNKIILDLKGANSIHMLFCSKYYIFFIHAYSSDGKTIRELITKNINGKEVSPISNGITVTVPIEAWISGFAIVSYTMRQPSLSFDS